jgi:hypothetical protein
MAKFIDSVGNIQEPTTIITSHINRAVKEAK